MELISAGLAILSVIILPTLGWAYKLQRQVDQLDRDHRDARHAMEKNLRAELVVMEKTLRVETVSASQFQALEGRLDRWMERMEDKLDAALRHPQT